MIEAIPTLRPCFEEMAATKQVRKRDKYTSKEEDEDAMDVESEDEAIRGWVGQDCFLGAPCAPPTLRASSQW